MQVLEMLDCRSLPLVRWGQMRAITPDKAADVAACFRGEDTVPRYVGDSFSLNMLANKKGQLSVVELTLDEAKTLIERGFASGNEYRSCVGHADTAAIISAQLGREVAYSRDSISLQEGDAIIACQYSGPRLPEGATALPEGATITYVFVRVVPFLRRGCMHTKHIDLAGYATHLDLAGYDAGQTVYADQADAEAASLRLEDDPENEDIYVVRPHPHGSGFVVEVFDLDGYFLGHL
jgi:hypothetical protein